VMISRARGWADQAASTTGGRPHSIDCRRQTWAPRLQPLQPPPAACEGARSTNGRAQTPVPDAPPTLPAES